MANTTERNALYPGSFDPPTNGHKWVIERVAEKYDKGIVAIGKNTEKTGRFPVPQRREMLEGVAIDLPNIIVDEFMGLYQADFAEMVGARFVVRGVRNATDFDYERDNRYLNETINPELQTDFITPPKDLLQISSSTVMGLLGFEGWQEEVRKMVPENVFNHLEDLQKVRDKEFLARKFVALGARLGVAEEISRRVFEEKLYPAYTEPDRKYHTDEHQKMIINELEHVRDLLDNPDAVEMALVLHDVVHNEHKSDPSLREKDDIDETKELARQVIMHELGLSSEFADEVNTNIEATRHTNEKPPTSDAQHTSDIDLSIFGRSKRLYDIYEDEKIPSEYYWVPDDVFAKVRGGMLKSFFEREHIYWTGHFHNKYNAQARTNLERAYKKLLARPLIARELFSSNTQEQAPART